MRTFLATLCVLLSAGGGQAVAQSGSDIVNIFGGLVQTAISQAIQAEWRKISPSEIACIDQNLQQRGSSINSIVQQNIGPNDGRLFDVRSSCRSTAAQPSPGQPSPVQARRPTAVSVYAVDGLNLGGRVHFDSASYREYRCAPSEQFADFTWCQKKAPERTARGPFVSSYSILHSDDGTVSYVNRYLEPAWFSGDEASEDIGRLSRKFGIQPNLVRMPQKIDGTQGVMAYWGSVNLQPLDETNTNQLAAGRDVQAGLMIDFIGNFRRSAQLGLPIFRLKGGPGYVWAANWDQNGRGTLRFLAVDPDALSGTANVQAPSPPAEASPGPLPTPSAPSPVSSAPPAAPAVPDTTSTARQRIKSTLARIADQRNNLPNDSLKAKLDNIASMLATAGEQTDSETLKGLLLQCDAAAAVFNEASEFRQVFEIATRKVAIVNSRLESVSFDAPLVQEIKSAVSVVMSAQSNGNLPSLKQALSALNNLYDTDKLSRLAEAKAQGFDTIESYEDFKDRQSRLIKSGIRLNGK